jgi:hypothetical protein
MLGELAALGAGFMFFLMVAVIWETIWKGMGLWYAARNGHKGWYVAILVLNTLGILPIIYILMYTKKKQTTKVVKKRRK